MKSQLNTYDAFKYHWLVWKCTGIKVPKKYKIIYIIYAILLNLFITISFPITLIVNLFFAKNLQDLCKNLTITVTDVISNLKFLNVFLVRSDLIKIKYILKKLDRRNKTYEENKILKNSIDKSHSYFKIFFFLYTMTTITSELTVILSNEKILMYPAWFPIDWKKSTKKFLIVHFYQLFGLYVQGIQDVANDTYPIAYLSVLCGHIDALSERIKNIGKSKNKSMNDNYQDLIDCIKDHQIILKLYTKITRIISITCFAQFLCSGLVQSTIAISLLYLDFDLSIIINMALFFSAVTLEIFVICNAGNNLMESCQNLCDAIYSCEWMDQKEKFKKTLIIFLHKSQKSMIIMAGNIIPVSLPTFVVVIKSAYSFFALLNEIK